MGTVGVTVPNMRKGCFKQHETEAIPLWVATIPSFLSTLVILIPYLVREQPQVFHRWKISHGSHVDDVHTYFW